MRVYITDLEAYNQGHLVGTWHRLPMNEDLLAEAIENELYKGRLACNSDHHHEEYFITDWECNYMAIGEYDSLTKLNKIAETMEDLEEVEKVAVTLLLNAGVVDDLDDAIENIDNIHCTGETSMENIAYNYVDESGYLDNKDSLSSYFNFDALGRDMEINGSYYTDDDNIIWEYVA